MPEGDLSSNSSSEEFETPINGRNQKNKNTMSEYEKQRLKRIEENRARMEALGLPKMASSLKNSVEGKDMKTKKIGKRGKGKMVEEDDDEEYRPTEEESGPCSLSEEDEESSGSRMRKGKKKNSTPKKKVQVQKLKSNSDFIDDDEDLLQAIALSLQDSAFCGDKDSNGLSRSPHAYFTDATTSERKGKAHIQEDPGKRKRKKRATSRVQMTEDELVVHFFQFDEAGKGTINLRDLRRVSAAHDFTWTDKELADMIYCFDSDGDAKLSLDEFQKIVRRCNMIQSPE